MKKNVFSISAIDLFCGIGGLSYGLKKAGIKVEAGIDQDKTCKYAFEANNKAEFIGKDITDVKGNELKIKYWNNSDIKVLVGCAPCQPFSSHSNKIDEKQRELDKKWSLLNEFIRLVKELEPQVISMENVPNLSNKIVFKEFVDDLISLGYDVSYQNVYCPDYGIPQKRRRLVLLASRLGKIELIKKTHKPSKYKTVKKSIGRLEKVENGKKSSEDPLHFSAELSSTNFKRIKASKPNGTWLDWDEDLRLECHKKATGKTYTAVYGRMSWDEPSPTITTQFHSYGTGRFGHPEQNRALTIREAAILQTFPKNYKFIKNKDNISIKRLGVHIGNAVPVDLGYVIGKSITQHIEDTTK